MFLIFRKYVLIFFSGLLLIGCNNDLDIIDDYRETPIIYGLLSLSDSIQYVRVQKAYLGEGNALLMAQNSDSIYYNANEISLRFEESVNGSFTRNIPLFPDSSHAKNEGLFVNYPHLIYRTESFTINKNARYKLVFNTNKTGKTVTASTPIVDNVQTPSILGIQSVNIANPNPLPIAIYPVTNGKIYGLNVVFKYSEKKRSDPGNFYEKKSIVFPLADIVVNNISSLQTFDFKLKGEDFYTFIGARIPIDTTLVRPAMFPFVSLDFVFTTGAEDFYIYYSINQPSNNINQNIPDFTNLSEGKGIFSSRNKNTFGNIRLNDASTTMLISGSQTIGRFE